MFKEMFFHIFLHYSLILKWIKLKKIKNKNLNPHQSAYNDKTKTSIKYKKTDTLKYSDPLLLNSIELH